ncbi:hypothetical protein [Butyrivibrio sp. MC2021]|uniref:hypothetical protein n=1 Tax=Butyrivibrio sp. MC2021 TaxID=1408306 RepID=UPI000479FCFE|nr:hypothetical protein [Butyrivibrio sp. MC2021]
MELLSKINKVVSNIGDHAEARVTSTNRKVATFTSGDGTFKASKTEYPNGTVHETRTYKKK